MGLTRPGRRVELEIFRNGKIKILKVKIGRRDGELLAGEEKRPRKHIKSKFALGLSVKELDDETRERLRIPEKIEGVVITSIKENSVFARTMLERGDVIVAINRKRIDSVRDFYRMMKRAKKEGNVLLKVYRDGGFYYVAVELE